MYAAFSMIAVALAVPGDEVNGSPTASCPTDISGLLEADWTSGWEGISVEDARLQGTALVVVLKERRRLMVFSEGRLAVSSEGDSACWKMGLGFAPAGHKEREGDGKTPEGWYRTSDKSWSSFYGAIAVHYPNATDAEAGRVAGRIDSTTALRIVEATQRGEKPHQATALGGEILIHGGGGATDWTLGCMALDDTDIDALRAGLPAGMRTDVLVLP